jgi:acetyl esterase/lipase
MPTPEMTMAGSRLKNITASARDAMVSAGATGGTGLAAEIVAAREFYAVLGREFTPDPDVRIAPITVGGVPGELVRAGGSAPTRTVILLNGGGWLAGRAAEYRQLAGRLSRVTAARVVVPDYRRGIATCVPSRITGTRAWESGIRLGPSGRRLSSTARCS